MHTTLYIFQAVYVLISVAFLVSIFVGRERRSKFVVLILGVALFAAGISTLITGTIPSRRNMGPPITGGLAKIGGIFLLALSLYAFYLAFTHNQPGNEEDT
jgi:hypothetical protein